MSPEAPRSNTSPNNEVLPFDDIDRLAATLDSVSHIPRRQLLKLFGVTAVASAVRLDEKLTHDHWPDGKLKLETLEPMQADKVYDEGWVIAPGFGNQGGRIMAEQMRRWVPPKKTIAWLDYPNQGFTLSQITSKSNTYSRHLRHKSIYGHSMGGATILEASRPTASGASCHPPTPLHRIILNCSPFDIDDAHDGAIAKVMTAVGKAIDYQGELVGTYIGTLGSDIRRDGYGDLFSDIFRAFKQTANGSSPKLDACMMQILSEKIDLNKNWQDFIPIITPATEALYCYPSRSRIDTTVNNTTAFPKWSRFFEKFGVNLKPIGFEHGGHANTQYATVAVKQYLADPSV